MTAHALGLDFGTESARAVVVEAATGLVRAVAAHPYRRGVITTHPTTGAPLPPGWALQDPEDWIEALGEVVPAALATAGVTPRSLVGVGVAATSCTLVPADADGRPLSSLPAFRDHPHAWCKLWKHQAAESQANRLSDAARTRGESWLGRHGGRLAPEWVLPQALQIAEEAPEIYRAAARLVEAGDWIVWQLTGRLVRNTCAAAYKACWHEAAAAPTVEFLAAAHPLLEDLYRTRLAGTRLAPGARAGGLGRQWARRLGLPEGTPVAAAMVDAHAAALGAGVHAPDVLFMIMGTSACQLLMSEREVAVDGIAGVARDGILPGLFAYEAGQPAVGDLLAWVARELAPAALHEDARRRGLTARALLDERAGALAPGAPGLLALDWWNGSRSPLKDGGLSGALIGATLTTRAEDIYRALAEATAFGARAIVERLAGYGLPARAIVIGGGLARSPFLVQLHADVLGRDVAVTAAEQPSATGAAMLGAVAAGRGAGGHDSLAEAAAMRPPPGAVYRPCGEHRATYEALYRAYLALAEYLGRGDGRELVARLARLRAGAP